MVELPATPSVASRVLALAMMRSLRVFGGVVRPGSTPLRIVREAFDALGRTPLPRGTKVKPVTAGGVPSQLVTAREARDSGRIMLYLHGGGFVCGSPRTHRQLASRISASAGLPVLVLDYRLAPEYPFPAAAEDALSAYRWLLGEGYQPSQIVVGGDSAGGHLTACLLADIADEKLPMPSSAVMLSPFLDLTGAELASRDKALRDPFVPPDYAIWCGTAYAGEMLTHHRLDVLKVRKRGWPPVLIHVGDTECLRGDSEQMAESLRRSGSYCDLRIWPGQVHVFHWFAPWLPEANAALRQIGEFVREVASEIVAA
ncbi:alpha/beta hydrolase [Kibdelosporangium phytohabitans]|uniref:alpha/beta hydrolase n=1 Tax=Kibdelosporangium phytohabitans TaxID=860235 RepID=UPI0009FB0092|nr:alpha/beta hydrolase [Kibdelosporangium phytohabitans]MBE1466717.1 acetyl esterase/lipase [Kibdelosporangium phytohabitans]